jgi:hypothetical protein
LRKCHSVWPTEDYRCGVFKNSFKFGWRVCQTSSFAAL